MYPFIQFMNTEKKLQKMADYHRKQSGFSDKDQAPPTPEAYREKKGQYDILAKRVNENKNYDYLRGKIRNKKIVDKQKPVIEISAKKSLGMRAYGWSKKYSDNYDRIFNH